MIKNQSDDQSLVKGRLHCCALGAALWLPDAGVNGTDLQCTQTDIVGAEGRAGDRAATDKSGRRHTVHSNSNDMSHLPRHFEQHTGSWMKTANEIVPQGRRGWRRL